VKVSGNKNDVYGKLYLQRKDYERGKNDKGQYREIAAARLAQDKARRKPMDAGLKELLEKGTLPAAALHERSKRWAVKVFLAHWFEEAYRTHYGVEPPKPYPIAILGHAHLIKPQ
jgi:hypothetical protein